MKTYPTPGYRIANQRKCYLEPRYLGEVANQQLLVLRAAHVTSLAISGDICLRHIDTLQPFTSSIATSRVLQHDFTCLKSDYFRLFASLLPLE